MPKDLYGHEHGNTPKGVGTIEREIDVDRACVRCGYNLRGLQTGGVCPECGERIRGKRSGGDRLGEAPMRYLVRLRLGFVLLGTGFLGLVPPVFFTAVSNMFLAPVAFGLWLTGLTIVLLPRARVNDTDTLEEKRTWNILRGIVIAVQPAPALAIGGLLVFGAGNVAVAVSEVLVGVWLVGMVPLGFYLALLCQWAEDDSLTNRWRGGGWSVGGAGALATLLGMLLLIPTPQGFILSGLLQFIIVIGTFVGWIMRAVAIVGMVWLAVLAFQSAHMVHWARRNVITERERDERMEKRWRERASEMVREAELANPNAFDSERFDPVSGAPVPAAAAPLPGPMPGPMPGSMEEIALPRAAPARPESPLSPAAVDGSRNAPGRERPRRDAVPPPIDMGSNRPDLNPYELSGDD